MKRILFNVFIILSGLFCQSELFAQSKAPELLATNNPDILLKQIKANMKIDADSTLMLLSNWSDYEPVKDVGRDYKFYYTDADYGKIPLRVYIPANYQNTRKTPCVLQLHGAVGQSKFSDIDSLADSDEGILTDPLKANNYIIIQPLGDKSKGFTWGGNKWLGSGQAYHFNLTYKKLTEIITALKQVLNIDDNRVYAFGHSDGSDGAIGLAVYKPDQFAGVVAYNTMFKNLFTHDYYIRNVQNRPLYEVHSDKDKLRRIGMNRQIIDSIKKFDKRITYKEYTGYEHWDKHLGIDAPYADKFMKGVIRNPYQSNIYLETTQNSPYNSCDWLTITKPDTSRKSAAWYNVFDVRYKEYLETRQLWIEGNYYEPLKSAVVQASYKDNVFTLQTSATNEVELKISAEMVDLNKPITVMANGKQVFKEKVKADKSFLLNGFQKTFDRQALWVNSIKIKID
ncbi:alpha/beta hydrolase-fold protein [Mucilaginibacter sp.]|jgi:predicted esterase|uniref:alpha/beta hydrolase-fold protein n=1 Tax=Mucilaginibacter sp. TaxID=1882438 RepID=UPI003566090B